MARAHKLTPLQVKNHKEPGYLLDGAGLILKTTPGGSKSWIYRYMLVGKDTWLGLGPYPEVSLADAREQAAELRKRVRAGSDPLAERQEAAATIKADRAKAVTFAWCAEQYIEAHKSGWKNAKHADQWRNTLETYAGPVIGELNVSKIETGHIMKILEPIWTEKAETASRLRGRIESVLDWATVRKHRTGDNPARWKGHLDTLLAARSKRSTVKNHPALPYAQMSAFMADLRKREGTSARAVEFGIMTAARSNEVRGAKWSEIDEAAGLWTVPADRMKAGREHRVTLSAEALELLQRMKKVRAGDLIFPGSKIDKDGNPNELSDMALTQVIRRMSADRLKAELPGWLSKEGDIATMHGFRSTFRDWIAEETNYPGEMAELALAHAISNATEAAYRRGDMVTKRRGMMQAWANHAMGTQPAGITEET